MDTTFWGDDVKTPCLRSLKALLVYRFGCYGVTPDNLPMRSPSQCGLHLLRATLPDHPVPQKLGHMQAVISGTPQHRVEWMMPDSPILPALYCYDGRAMYLGCAQYSEGGGRAEWSGCRDVQPHDRGRYTVVFSVPQGYDGPGILPVKAEDHPGWDWPTRGSYLSQCSCAQARLAEKMGWSVQVVSANLLSLERGLAPWACRIKTIYERACLEGRSDLARAARDVCLHAIGSLHRTGMRRTAIKVSKDDLSGVGACERMMLDRDGHLAVETEVFRGGWWQAWMAQPAWSAAVWGVAQYRVTRAMMDLPQSSIVAVYGDAIYTTEPLPSARNNEVGWLRLKKGIAGPLRAPRGWTELREIMS